MRLHQIGQTLVEVLITVLIIAVSVISLIRFQHYLAYDSNLTQQKADAMSLASKEMESLRYFQVQNTTSGYTAYQDIVTGSSAATISNTTYTINWTVTTDTNPNYKVVNVAISWTDRYSNANSVTLVSDIAGIDPAHSASIM